MASAQPSLEVIASFLGKKELLTPLQLLDFHKSETNAPHIEGVLRYYREEIAIIRCIYANCLPLSHIEIGAPTFLQWSHK